MVPDSLHLGVIPLAIAAGALGHGHKGNPPKHWVQSVGEISVGIPVPISTRILGGPTAGKAGIFSVSKFILKNTWICATPVCNFLAKHTSF